MDGNTAFFGMGDLAAIALLCIFKHCIKERNELCIHHGLRDESMIFLLFLADMELGWRGVTWYRDFDIMEWNGRGVPAMAGAYI